MDIGGAVGVEDDDIARVEVRGLGRELDVVDHPEQRARTADLDGGRRSSRSTWIGSGWPPLVTVSVGRGADVSTVA